MDSVNPVPLSDDTAALPLPTSEDEAWRYTPIDRLDLDAYPPAPPARGPRPVAANAAVEALTEAVGSTAGVLVTVDGALVSSDLDPAWTAQGLVVGPGSTAPGGPGSDEPRDRIDAWARSAAPEPVEVQVPPGLIVTDPLVVLHWVDAEQAAAFPALAVRVGADAEVTVVEMVASGAGRSLVVPRLALDVGPAARLAHLGVQELGAGRWSLAGLHARLADQSSLRLGVVALGGEYAVVRSDCQLSGPGGSLELVSLAFAGADQLIDQRTFVQHEAPHTTSELVATGVVGDHGRTVTTGLIHVHPEARGTNADQTNRSLKLGDHAWAESVPNLEIENNDVRCSHASAVGPVDAEQRFYLESRGIPPEEAERLIVAGTFEAALERLPVPAPVPHLRTRLWERYRTLPTATRSGEPATIGARP